MSKNLNKSYLSGKFYVNDVRKVSNIPAKGVCPWEKNVYKTDGFEVRIKLYQIKFYNFILISDQNGGNSATPWNRSISL